MKPVDWKTCVWYYTENCSKNISQVRYAAAVYSISLSFPTQFILLVATTVIRESLPCSNPPFKALGASFTLMAHRTSACEEGLQSLCLACVTFKSMIKQMKRKYDFQRCWILSNTSIINLKKDMKGKQNKWRGFSRIFTVCVALLSLKVREISP